MHLSIFSSCDSPGSQSSSEAMSIEKDILPAVAGTGKGRVFVTNRWWSQIKTAGSAIYANRSAGRTSDSR